MRRDEIRPDAPKIRHYTVAFQGISLEIVGKPTPGVVIPFVATAPQKEIFIIGDTPKCL